MATLVMNAPSVKVQRGTIYRTFQDIFMSGTGLGYAISANLVAQLGPGSRVVLLSKDVEKRAEGELVQLIPVQKAGNGIQRYDVRMKNMRMVPYHPERLNKNGVAVI